MSVLSGNLTYTKMVRPEKLTNEIFLLDLYTMAVVDPPHQTLEIILDKLRKSLEGHYAALRTSMPEIYRQLEFSEGFARAVGELTGRLRGSYGKGFAFDEWNIKKFDCFGANHHGRIEE